MVKKRPKSRPARVSGAASTPRDSSASESVDDENLAALSSMPQTAPVRMKVCRLCETKDGPFLNIFDIEKVTAKRIGEVLPFTVAENDDLPDKICFRCSAKLEELYEFILKCIKTQENLRTAIGKKTPLVTKSRFRVQWENQLNKKNISNDDICNALIKKAIEGIKDIPLNTMPAEDDNPPKPPKKVKNGLETVTLKKDKETAFTSSKNNITYESDNEELRLKQATLSLEKCDDHLPLARTSRSNKPVVDSGEVVVNKVKHYPSRRSQSKVETAPVNKPNVKTNVANGNNDTGKSIAEEPKPPPAKVPEPPPINIMDHVSIIKVNDVGTLFLCKLCNRNFLKKELVLTHGCAKNNVPKDKFLHNQAPPREVPKPSTVKYIKMDKDFKKPVMQPAPTVPPPAPENKLAEKRPHLDAIKVNIPVQPDFKTKPKIGPASKVKKLRPTEAPQEPTPPLPKPPIAQEQPIIPEVQFPTMPSLNSLYKLVPGPNNTFTLVQDAPKSVDLQPTNSNKPGPKSRRSQNKIICQEDEAKLNNKIAASSDVIDLDDSPEPAVIQQPYPVGLFQTAHHSGGFAPTLPKPPSLTTPAMKKQSYTIVQTGNPSKLLISTKPQPVAEEPQRKKSRKSKLEARETITEPYNVTLEDNTQNKDAGFFTFINVDPLLQPSYVLPTDNIIQESQISTSTPASKPVVDTKEKEKDNKYSCNMCEETFSREKKLLTHIQSHFNQMDEEDQLRRDKVIPKKKTRKS